jgi:hypothetical protein
MKKLLLSAVFMVTTLSAMDCQQKITKVRAMSVEYADSCDSPLRRSTGFIIIRDDSITYIQTGDAPVDPENAIIVDRRSEDIDAEIAALVEEMRLSLERDRDFD